MSAEKRTIVALFAIALGLRVLYGVFLAAHPDIAPDTATAELQYAKEILSGTGWITEPYSPRAPGYPVFLALFYALAVKQIWLVTFIQAAVGALTVLIVYRLGRSILGSVLALAAALWFALNLQHMHVGYALERNIVAICLLMLVLHLLVRPFVRMRYALVAGIVCAVLVHVDPQFMLLLPVFAVFVFFKTRHRYLNIQYLFVFLGLAIAASVPWTLRNYSVYGQPIPIALEAERFLRPAKLAVTEPLTVVPELQGKIVEASRSRFMKENAVEFWRIARFRDAAEEPGKPADWPRESAWSVRHNLASILNYGIILPFFLVGVAYALRTRSRTALMLAAVVAVYFLMRVYLGGSALLRLPVDPLIIVLGFYGVLGLAKRFAPAEPPGTEPLDAAPLSAGP
jgi:4-amino-4-deoxy-L-arabinose transferase-like glycosyltransferase